MPRVFLASRNAKKLGEMRRILAEHLHDVEVLGLDDVPAYHEPVEDQPTFAGNALLKARAGLTATGLPTVADDSGLCVDALNGMPGVLSARWSGQPKSDRRNNELLLQQLADVPDERRGAHFACAVAFWSGTARRNLPLGLMGMRKTIAATAGANLRRMSTPRTDMNTPTTASTAPARQVTGSVLHPYT